jgi:rubrerythrin
MFIGLLAFNSCSNMEGNPARLRDPVGLPGSAGQKPTGDKNPGMDSQAQNTKTTSIKDLQEAFAGESTASAKYTAYSKKAELEGFHTIALLFKATSAAEKIHANNHKAVLLELGIKIPFVNPQFTVKTTKENLEDATKGESYESTTMYPKFLRESGSDENQLAVISLSYAFKTEQKHLLMFENALLALNNNTVKTLPSVYYVCPTCGNTYDRTPGTRCGFCMMGSERFMKVNGL